VKVFWATKRVAFGSTLVTWAHVRRLHEMGLTHVINLRSSRRYRTKLRSFHILWLPFPDDKEPRPAWFYRDALRFYKRSMERPDSKVFVMCHHGICRSASLTYFFLRLSGKSANKSEALLLKVRPRAILARAYRESCDEFLLHRHRLPRRDRPPWRKS
jgi:protein-tyrosine phosphatase